MLGLFGSLNMASRAMSAYQEATAVAGNNVANVNNTAYSREELNIQSSTSLPTPVGEEGTGVDALSITQIRSSILDAEITTQTSESSSYSAEQSALQNAEAELNEQISTSGTSSTAASPNGISASLSNFFNSLQSLSANPSDTTLRQQVIASAQQLSNQFNSISGNLTTLQSNLKSSVTSDVAAANQDLSDIAGLNQQIVVAQASGASPNELIDLRQSKLEDLASKMNFSQTAQPDGAVNVDIGGAQLVNGSTTPNVLISSTDASGNIVVLNSGNSATLNISGGSIAGEISASNGAIQSTLNSIQTLASTLITQVNTVYSAGYDLSGNTGANLFTGNGATNISVNSSVTPQTFQAAGVAGAPGDNTVVGALAKLATQSIGALGNTTFSANYSSVVSALGSAISTAGDNSSNATSVMNLLSQQRDSVSGVSTDEELTNIVQFQKAYQASAELVTTINNMLETVITMKTV